MSVENELPLKPSADGYILIVMGNRVRGEWSLYDYNQALAKMNDSLAVCGLKTKVQVIFPECYEKLYQPEYSGIDIVGHYDKDDNLSKDCWILRSKRNSLLLIRNDGTIVAKNILNYSDRIVEDGKTTWTFRTKAVCNLINDDIESQKKAGINYMFFLIIPLCILISSGIAYLIYMKRLKVIRKRVANKRLISELELKAIRAQMNPHFVFNALSSIQHLINQGKNDKANQYLLDFSNLLRMVLATSEKILISLSDEAA